MIFETLAIYLDIFFCALPQIFFICFGTNSEMKRFRTLHALTLVLLSITMFAIVYVYFEIEGFARKGEEVEFASFNEKKIVHLDLKGAAPKVSYLKKLFPLMARAGVTGLLIEYEDMFPYTGTVKGVRALNAYTMDEIKEILHEAKNNEFDVIPLVNTFGHMEYVLKLNEFKGLREEMRYPQAICPSNEVSLAIIREMLRQMIEAHPEIKTVHVGCDEVFQMGTCDRCRTRLKRNGWFKFQLFHQHVVSVAKFIKTRFPTVNVLIWEDMLRGSSEHELLLSKLSDWVEPIVWNYHEHFNDMNSMNFFENYVSVFPNIWIASAFKGTTGSNQMITNATYHVLNTRAWMTFIQKYRSRTNIQGIFLTGWQRYDHFSVLCELLPVGIPSLFLCLRQLMGFRNVIPDQLARVADELKCENPSGLEHPRLGDPRCAYPGADLLHQFYTLRRLQERYHDSVVTDGHILGWLSNYNVKYAASNAYILENITPVLDEYRENLQTLKAKIIEGMSEIYDQYAIGEFIDTYIQPFENEINDLSQKKEELLKITASPNRPFNRNFSINNQLRYFN